MCMCVLVAPFTLIVTIMLGLNFFRDAEHFAGDTTPTACGKVARHVTCACVCVCGVCGVCVCGVCVLPSSRYVCRCHIMLMMSCLPK